MPIDEFIITVFCWVEPGFEKVTEGVKLRTRGFAPRLSDREVITMELVGEFLGYEGDEAIWKYCDLPVSVILLANSNRFRTYARTILSDGFLSCWVR